MDEIFKFENHDNPIEKDVEDKLGFLPLAKRVATAIVKSDIDTKNSYTISIEGQWGSGKTSLVNLIKKEIKEDVILMEFNPWMVTDFEQLIKYFFSELLKEIIHNSDEAKFKEDMWKDIKKFVSFFTPEKVHIGFGDIKVAYSPKDMLFSEKDETILELKTKINKYLKSLKKRIVVIVDDIDRLTDKETETFFRLIKGIADFDNIIYLLLYDKAIVAKSLEQFKQENGEKYLDKIVQYPISIPKVYHSVYTEILFDKLDNILKKIKKYNFNQEKWNTLVPILEKYIKNIRDINKVVSVISFEYPQIAEDVEFTDFFILSLIKVQKYELYTFIRDKKYIFDDSKYNPLIVNSDEIKKEEFKQAKKEFLEKSLLSFSDYKLLFYKLFPAMEDSEYYRWYPPFIHKYKPLDSNDYFDNYFTFVVAKNKLSSKDYTNLVQKLFSNDFQAFKKSILEQKEVHILFLDMFKETDREQIEKNVDSVKNIILNLLSIHELLVSNNSIFLSASYLYLNMANELFKNVEESDTVLNSIYFEANYISLSTKLSFYRELMKYQKDERKFSQEMMDNIKKRLSTDIELIKVSDFLGEQEKTLNTISNISSLISSLKLLDIPIENFITEIKETMFKSRKDFFDMLNLFKQELRIDKGEVNVIYYSKISEHTDIPVSQIEEYMKQFDKKSFSEKELAVFKAVELSKQY